ncbi:MAG: hypothetical protein RLZZ574_571, partial [Cyanobacteriota bacterium]
YPLGQRPLGLNLSWWAIDIYFLTNTVMSFCPPYF